MTFGRCPGLLRGAFIAAMATLLVVGCAAYYQGWVDPSLFPRSPRSADASTPAPVAILGDPALTDYKYVYDKQWDEPDLTIPAGRIIEAAAMAAMTDVLGRPVERFPDAQAAVAASRSVVRPALVVLRPVGLEVPVPGARGFQARLVLDCQVLDADRALLWSKRYVSGGVGLSTEQLNDRDASKNQQFVRATHAAAYAVMVQVAEDLRRWLEAERLRERLL